MLARLGVISGRGSGGTGGHWGGSGRRGGSGLLMFGEGGKDPSRPPRSMNHRPWTTDDADGIGCGCGRSCRQAPETALAQSVRGKPGSCWICHLSDGSFALFPCIPCLTTLFGIFNLDNGIHHHFWESWESWPSGYWPSSLPHASRPERSSPVPRFPRKRPAPTGRWDGWHRLFPAPAPSFSPGMVPVSSWLPSPSRTERKQRIIKELDWHTNPNPSGSIPA